ncbi:MAG: hypothetical protein Q4P24_06200 [Rhodobacterales bacterium]|nr:hypothetical protein [Rhodobacterales bacterium]
MSEIEFTTRAWHAATAGDWLTGSYTDGFLVMRHGKIVSEQYFNGMEGIRHICRNP